ncbi:hypothetical protein G9H72_08630 [Motilibacter sp. K478]|uniref:glycoside hydrolase family 78 protein n=1 Tax=Motilibacter aurantiacus TaxID=2714955 RepID=UPI001407455A|nr:hypothetical protein [Motilibacter aurantiacus]NHC45314.1 hypothetical protein [Motilibacter aurantiacus]
MKEAASLAMALGSALSVGSSGVLVSPAAATQTSVKPWLSVVGLEVNHLTERPLGIDEAEPVFCWGMESNILGAKQGSYRIEVATDRSFRRLAWDSGTSPPTSRPTSGTAAPGRHSRCGRRPTTGGA